MEKIRDNVKAFRAYLNTMDEVCCDFFVDGNYVRCFFYQDYINEPTEKVLTKRETDAYLRGQNAQGVNITINGLTVREEADINKIANVMVRKLKEASLGYSSIGGMA